MLWLAGWARLACRNVSGLPTCLEIPHLGCSAISSVSKKWLKPLFRGSKFGQPEVARICKELILQAKSTTQQGAVFPQGKTAVAKRLGFSFEKPTVRRQSRLTRIKVRGAAAPPTPSEGFLTVWGGIRGMRIPRFLYFNLYFKYSSSSFLKLQHV